MDLFDDSRALVYSSELARRQRSDLEWHGWTDLDVTLLDNFRESPTPRLLNLLKIKQSCTHPIGHKKRYRETPNKLPSAFIVQRNVDLH